MERLRQRADFLAVAAGVRIGAPAFTLQGRVRQNLPRNPVTSTMPARIGFTVTKKTGNAVVRNRIRRRLREMVKRAAAASLRTDCDYVLVARRDALHRSFATLQDDFQSAATRLDRRMAQTPTAVRETT